MPGMTPSDFFEGFLFEDYADWKNEPTSIRRGFHVAVSAFHLADHYFRYHARMNPAFAAKYNSLNKFQAALTRRTPSFKVIQDIANAYKHLYTRASCSISSGGSVESVNLDGREIEQNWQGSDGNYKGDIAIRHRTGAVTQFSAAIAAVIEMWTDIINQDDPAAI
jgi:hypothetical protein